MGSWILSLLFVIIIWLIRIVIGMLLWKWIVVGLLGFPMISFFQFIGLQILIQILTGRGIKAKIRAVEQEDYEE